MTPSAASPPDGTDPDQASQSLFGTLGGIIAFVIAAAIGAGLLVMVVIAAAKLVAWAVRTGVVMA